MQRGERVVDKATVVGKIDEMMRSGIGLKEAAAKMNIHHSTYYYWRKHLKKTGRKPSYGNGHALRTRAIRHREREPEQELDTLTLMGKQVKFNAPFRSLMALWIETTEELSKYQQRYGRLV